MPKRRISTSNDVTPSAPKRGRPATRQPLQHGGADRSVPLTIISQPPAPQLSVAATPTPSAPTTASAPAPACGPAPVPVPVLAPLQLFRNPPSFSGAPDGIIVTSYRIQAERYLSQFNCSEHDKLTSLMMGITGVAQQLVLPRMSSFTTASQMLDFLQQQFLPKPKRPTQLARSLKQLPGESVQVFKTRIEAEMSTCLIGTSFNESALDDYCLEALRNGLRSEYRNLLLMKRVTGFRDAADYILSVADDVKLKDHHSTSGSPSGYLNAIQPQPQYQSTQQQQSYPILHPQPQHAQFSSHPPHQHFPVSSPPAPYPQPFWSPQQPLQVQRYLQARSRTTPSSPAITCLFCGKLGHRFRNCRTASETDKSAIIRHLPAIFASLNNKTYKDFASFMAANIASTAPTTSAQNLLN